MKYYFCIQFRTTCSFCKKAVVVSYDYDEEEGIIDVVYKCNVINKNHGELNQCKSFECNRVGEYERCKTCKK